MNIVRVSTEFLVALDPPRIVRNDNEESYEVHRVAVEQTVFPPEGGRQEELWDATIRGYKLTKDGKRLWPLRLVVGHEALVLEDEAIEFVKGAK